MTRKSSTLDNPAVIYTFCYANRAVLWLKGTSGLGGRDGTVNKAMTIEFLEMVSITMAFCLQRFGRNFECKVPIADCSVISVQGGPKNGYPVLFLG